MYNEDDLLPIAALQHLAFCERQWGLMYLEQVWDENRLTAEGRVLHEQADEPGTEVRGDLRIARGLRLRSLELGLVGRADIVEFHAATDVDHGHGQNPACVRLEGVEGLWRPFPVEYKRGHPKIGRCDEVQLCAQALCLEEMLQATIPCGAIFYGEPRKRSEVVFDDALRRETAALAVRLHELANKGETPSARYEKKCRSCSLLDVCLPKATAARRSVRDYLAKAGVDTGLAGPPNIASAKAGEGGAP